MLDLELVLRPRGERRGIDKVELLRHHDELHVALCAWWYGAGGGLNAVALGRGGEHLEEARVVRGVCEREVGCDGGGGDSGGGR